MAPARCIASGPSSARLLGNMDMVLAKTDIAIAARYATLVADTRARKRRLPAHPRRVPAHAAGPPRDHRPTRASSRATRRSRAASATASPTSIRSTTSSSSCCAAIAAATPERVQPRHPPDDQRHRGGPPQQRVGCAAGHDGGMESTAGYPASMMARWLVEIARSPPRPSKKSLHACCALSGSGIRSATLRAWSSGVAISVGTEPG